VPRWRGVAASWLRKSHVLGWPSSPGDFFGDFGDFPSGGIPCYPQLLKEYMVQNFRENHPAGDLDSKDWSWNAPWMIRTARVNQRSSMWGRKKMALTSNKSCFV